MPYNRLEHKGGAVLTTLAADIGSAVTSLALTDATNWPTGTNPFYVVIDPGTSNEEKILATARSTLTLTGLTRGVDGTTASAHSAGAQVQHIFTAVEADEANNAAKSTIGTVTTKGDILVATANQILARQGVGPLGTVLQADSGQTNGLKWATIDATSFTSTAAGAGLGISGSALVVNVDGVTLVITSDALGVKASGIDTLQLKDGAVSESKIATNLEVVERCTAATRPGSPQAGDIIWEADTHKILQYQSATTGWTPPWNAAWGQMAEVTKTTQQEIMGLGAEADVTGLAVSFTAVANRRYQLQVSGGGANIGDGGTVEVQICSGASGNTGSISRQDYNSSLATTVNFGVAIRTPAQSPAAGVISYHIRGAVTGGTAASGLRITANMPWIFTASDIGPNGAPV